MDAPSPQHQEHQPGRETEMSPAPEYLPRYPGSGRLKDKVCLITGGDSGIGRAVSVLFAREGAGISFVYLEEAEDAEVTKQAVEREQSEALAIKGDVRQVDTCRQAVELTLERFGRIDILINNAAQQYPREDVGEISQDQLEKTFQINLFSQFYLVQAALDHLEKGSSIINTTSVTAYRGSGHLVDYAASKGAIVAYTRSLAQQLAPKGIRVNAVAPGPIWTPLIPATFSADEVAEFGKKTLMRRPGQPNEVAPAYLFLASEDASYMTGQVLHPNGGEIIGG